MDDDPRLETLVLRLPPSSRARHDYDLLISGKPQLVVHLDASQMKKLRRRSSNMNLLVIGVLLFSFGTLLRACG
jgi:hypothetical protein